MARSATGDDVRLKLLKDEKDFQERFDARVCNRKKKEFCEIVSSEDVLRSY